MICTVCIKIFIDVDGCEINYRVLVMCGNDKCFLEKKSKEMKQMMEYGVYVNVLYIYMDRFCIWYIYIVVVHKLVGES